MNKHGRVTTTHFGSFGKALGAAVHRSGWWFALASDVQLQGAEQTSHDVVETIRTCAVSESGKGQPARFERGRANRAASELTDCSDVSWLKSVAPGALQAQEEAFRTSPLRLGMVAARVTTPQAHGEAWFDDTYPFLLLEEDGHLLLNFSAEGPDPKLQQSILLALAERLLWWTGPQQDPEKA